jgi:sialic acid synthase SpsE
VFGEKSLEIAVNLNVDGIKIHATDFYNTKLVRAAIKAMPKIFISMGGISIIELEQFLEYHCISAGPQVCLMYGFQAEPTPIEANNLLRIGEIKKRFNGFQIGFMDHSDGSTDDSQSLALLALPFKIGYIEKHMTLDRILELEDYPSALSPKDLQTFINRVRRLEKALGTSNLELSEAEQTYRKKVLKVVVARKMLKKGDRILEGDISLKRVSIPGLIPVYRKEEVVGKVLKTDVQKHQQLTMEDII